MVQEAWALVRWDCFCSRFACSPAPIYVRRAGGQVSASTSAQSNSGQPEGKTVGDFQVTQSIEIGGRISEVTGSQPMYDTLVNYQSGARILEQSLTMQSLTHEDIFDTLTLNSFGWGGDPEQAARLRIAKYKWYTFSGSYQHIQNYFDYDLFANPLNPPTGGTPFIPVLNSPHTYYNRRTYTILTSSCCRCSEFRSAWITTATALSGPHTAAFMRARMRLPTRTQTTR